MAKQYSRKWEIDERIEIECQEVSTIAKKSESLHARTGSLSEKETVGPLADRRLPAAAGFAILGPMDQEREDYAEPSELRRPARRTRPVFIWLAWGSAGIPLLTSVILLGTWILV